MKKFATLLALAALAAGCGREKLTVEDGERALASGDFQTAAKAFISAVKEHPTSVPLYYNLGRAQSLAGDTSGAIASFREVLRFTPGDLDASEALAAELRKVGGNDALAESHELLDFVLPYREDSISRARVLNSLALTEEALHRNDLALGHLLLARIAAPEYAPSFFNLGHLAIALRQPVVAQRYLEAFLATKPRESAMATKATAMLAEATKSAPPPYSHTATPEAAALVKKGIEAYDRRDYANAESIFIKAIAEDPLEFDAIFNRANALYALGRKDEAVRAFDEASALKPDHFEANFSRASVAYSTANYAKAIEILTTETLIRWPDSPKPFITAAYSFAQLRRYYEAKIFGAIYVAVAKAASPKSKTKDFEVWLSQLGDPKFKL